jgi:glycosyltransferase involved in cell wall biosynthesis
MVCDTKGNVLTQISVLILTLNEIDNLPGALGSLKGYCDDVVVFDSFSSDNTTEVARQWGARVIQRKFDNYAGQRMAGLSVGFAHEWILILDADERVTPELWAEMQRKVSMAAKSTCMFRMRRKDMFLGRWLRRSSGYPTWFGRLIRPGLVRIEREINEEYVPLGQVELLNEHLIHFPFNRGISHWIDRHNSYSSMESVKVREDRHQPLQLKELFARDPVARRRALKGIAYRLPMRPTLVFLYLYIVRLGFIDGLPGFIYCRLRSAYEMQIDAKCVESECLRKEKSAEAAPKQKDDLSPN